MRLNEDNSKKIVESRLDYLKIGLDGAFKNTYEQIRRGGNYNLLISNIKCLVKQKNLSKSTYLLSNVQVVVTNKNEGEINQIKELSRKLGVDRISIKTMGYNIHDTQGYLKLCPKNHRYRRYHFQNGKLSHKRDGNLWCNLPWTSTLIDVNGDVIPCVRYRESYSDNNFSIGNVFKDSFAHIWNSKKYQKIRKKILDNKNNLPICSKCAGGFINDYVEVIDFT
jgi:radical SAM protein with 4Fe4S-binding SPASM domain